MKKVLAFLLLTLVACSNFPKKPFKTHPWYAIGNACFERLMDDDTIETVCMEDDETMISMPLKEFQMELNYQDELINRCRKWRR